MDMFKSVVFQGEEILGEVEVFPQQQQQQQLRDNGGRSVIEELREIRILYFSPPSERCTPLAVLHTISSSGMCFKMESKQSDSQLRLLHDSCTKDSKTAVMPLGTEELHLVPMYSRNFDRSCFWGFNVAKGLYNSCLVMLNLRCLGIVFDLDETLVVANTMRSFEDRIEGLQRKISTEVDPQRIAGMLAEVKRYQDDKTILKQYVENDQVIENGRLIKALPEVVPSFSDNHLQMVRPIIRFQEKNLILTRINPQIRDTSVLVRLRPAWEDLRSYLIARGRKRFEVYVCTMAERDYAMEMWRLLDPEWNLISSKELLDRIVCVKSGLRKSLFNVFQEGICHPKMALIIDDRLKVWEDQDQPRVHVVPAFAPYYAPQAEANNAIPVLCVARNVACNVRGGFFREFDEGLLQRMVEISYEDDFKDILSPPDVGNYLVSEDDASAVNGNRDPVLFDGMADAEVERRLKEAISVASAISSTANLDPRIATSLQYTMPSSSTTNTISLPAAQQSMAPFHNLHFSPQGTVVKAVGQVMLPEPSFQSSPAREEGEVPESELDPDTRRRLLILQHGQDSRDHMPSGPPFPVLQHAQDSRDHTSSGPPFPVRPPMQVQVPRVPPCSNWFPVEEEMSPRQITRAVAREFPLDTEPLQLERHRSHHSSFFPKVESSIQSDRIFLEDQRPKEAFHRTDQIKLGRSLSAHRSFSGPEMPLSRTSCKKDVDFDPERNVPNGESPAGVLHDIATKCGAKVEFKTHLVASTELLFSIEAWFSGEKIGEGIGRTRREAQWQAAEASIKHLANIYLSRIKSDSEPACEDTSRFDNPSENGFVASQRFAKEDVVPFSCASELSRVLDPRLEGSKKSMGFVYALKELCKSEGLEVVFQAQPPTNQGQKDEVYAQVEIDGQVLGKGAGLTWDEAKMQASEKALITLRTMLGQFNPKRQGSPRSLQGMSTKRPRPEFSRVMQRISSSGRYV